MFVITKIILLISIFELFRTCEGLNFEDFEVYLKRLDNHDDDKTFNKAKDGASDPVGDQREKLKVETVDVDANDHYESDYSKIIDQVPTPLSLRYVKESMDKDIACCMLGQIAGDKGYHCQASFYSNRIISRNRNRAHNRKLSFYGRDRVPRFGEKLMLRFERCLARKSFIFNKCCHLAATDKQSLFMPQYDTFKHHLYNLRHKMKH